MLILWQFMSISAGVYRFLSFGHKFFSFFSHRFLPNHCIINFFPGFLNRFCFWSPFFQIFPSIFFKPPLYQYNFDFVVQLVVYFYTFKRFIQINVCFILSIFISSISIIHSKLILILVTIFAFFISFIIVIDMIQLINNQSTHVCESSA